MKPATKPNSNIRDFFKPKKTTTTATAAVTHQTQSQPEDQSSSPDDPAPQSSVPSFVARSEAQMNSSALKNGKFVVENSDSEGSDSSDLDDIGVILGNKPAAAKVSAPKVRTPIKTRRPNVKFNASPIASRPAARNDLASLVKLAEIDKKAEAKREELLAIQNHKKSVDSSAEFDEQAFIESVVPDTEGYRKATKLMRAIKRQEAGKAVEGLWLFFDFDTVENKRSNFPQKSLSRCRWKSALTNISTFHQTIVSGFADDMIAMGEELPEELLLWILDEICFEKRDSIRHSFSRIIASHPAHTISELMNPAFIQRLFQNVGGTDEATNTAKKIGPLLKPVHEYKARSWDPLISLVSLLGSLGKSLSLEAQCYSICLLVRLCMDYIVMEKLALFQAIQTSLKSLITSIPEAPWMKECDAIKQTIFAFTELPTLHLQILKCIPDEGISRLHNFRRQLALSLFLNTPEVLTRPLSTTLDLSGLIGRLKAPCFQMNFSTNYVDLSARITFLDIAIADGKYPGLKLRRDSELEKEFNKNIDLMVQMLEVMVSGVMDANAAHPKRTAAKTVISLVGKRIGGTVRTEPKPKKDIWGFKTASKDLRPDNADMMLSYVKSAQQQS